MSDVTRILLQMDSVDPTEADQLLPLVYEELRKLAVARLAHEKPGQTLQATALVHEAYLRLMGGDGAKRWDSRGHFFAAAAEAMRRILINLARNKDRQKRGGQFRRVDLDAIDIAFETAAEDLLALDEALQELAEHDKLCADLVHMRFYAGLSLSEAAEALGISPRTADRHWAYARAWLFDRLRAAE